MPQGHAGPVRRRISSSEGWLGAPFTARWGLRTLFLGTRASCGTTTTIPRQAGRQLPWHLKGNACMGYCPIAVPQWVLAPWNGTGGNVPGWAASQQVHGSTDWCSERHRDGAGKKITSLRSLTPTWGSPVPLPLITTSLVLSIRCWQPPRGRHHLPATTSSYLCAPRELPLRAAGPNEQLRWELEHQTHPRGDLLHLESAARVLCPQPSPTSHQYPRAGWHRPPHRAGGTIPVPSEPSNRKLGCRQRSELPASSS